MKLSKFARLFGFNVGGIYNRFEGLKKNGLLEKEHYNIEYGLHQRTVHLTPEGMAMAWHLLKKNAS